MLASRVSRLMPKDPPKRKQATVSKKAVACCVLEKYYFK